MNKLEVSAELHQYISANKRWILVPGWLTEPTSLARYPLHSLASLSVPQLHRFIKRGAGDNTSVR